MAEKNYILFRPAQSQRPFTFLYPAGWEPREITQDGFTEVFIAGPLSQDGTYTVSFSVRESTAPAETAEGAASDYLFRHRSASSFREIGRKHIRVARNPAIEVRIAYTMSLPLYSVKAKQTTIREDRVFVKQGDQLYELIYAAPAEDYETWLEAFRTLVESFTFLDKPADRVSYRRVTTVVPQPVREDSPEYEAESGQSDEEDLEHHQN